MRATVKLHGHANFKTVEIDDVVSDGKLAAKLESRAAVAQKAPRKLFCCRFLPP
jgi:hypothetical protein